ncbi:ABC-type antimicrobial peptide transport system [Halorhodospira halochloris]|uniref:ABC-type antimicrobial peptide transport system n=1 Tax=Halorhodospira halochloris TaxID=1052 RepID=A0A110B1P2_HALHR|nr:FtsX-like permease family protein [Halorhodospira halochloris]MBK1651325.1 ABC transporter permease [Halorhodospira halochloris]MCG5549125.1 FtsX-like permease family protein [Halorhodospira halochloris]BAU57610.1 ABC-type antimicrobial peptide transport system [Halorhodospira halochloris]
MRALNHKLVRELVAMRSQVFAIAVVIAAGVATLVMFLTSLYALTETRASFYQDYRFADVFAAAERVPQGVVAEIESIPGVQRVAERVVAGANIEVAGFADPISGRIISLPDGDNAELNSLFLSSGRLPEPYRDDEVVISDGFAEAHELQPGDSLSAIVRGRYQRLEIVGVAISPEFIYQIRPGEFLPDFERYAIMWLNRSALAAAYDMEGSFNDVVLTLQRDARVGDVIDELDHLLEPWGGQGAYSRDHQLSHRLLEDEFEQLSDMTLLIPAIFLGVSAFLLNVVIGRLIATQRESIGILRAFGYSRLAIANHYLLLVLVILAIGLLLGVGLGYWLGEGMAALYADFFRFPFLDYQLQLRTVAIAALVTLLAGVAGTLVAVQRAAKLAPAQAMRPEPPPSFRPTVIERLGLQRYLGQPTRMILRSLERWPLRTMLSVTGIAFAVGILLIGPYQRNALDALIGVQFNLIQRDDVTVSFYEPTSRKVIHELAGLPGVELVEPHRYVSAEVGKGHRYQRMAILGLEQDASLRRLIDTDHRQVNLPAEGALITDYLAEMLDVEIDDTLHIRFLEGRRGSVEVPVSGIIAEYVGVSVYINLATLNRLMGEGEAVSGAWLAVDPDRRQELLTELDRRPRTASVTESAAAMRSFSEYVAETMYAVLFMTMLLASAIAFGVIYNNARIALAERARELASLRVLGFTRNEIGYILIGEQAVLIALALVPGFVIGHFLYAAMVAAVESELYRVPMLPSLSGMATASAVIFAVGLFSGWVVKRRLDRLDLIEVLKSRE